MKLDAGHMLAVLDQWCDAFTFPMGAVLKEHGALQAHIHRLTPQTAQLLEGLLRTRRSRKAADRSER